MISDNDITRLLEAYQRGDRSVVNDLVPMLYAEMRRIAGAIMRREAPGHTLQPTALANEAYLRLFEGSGLTVENRAHFYAVAARVMRRLLVDHARGKGSEKRGGNLNRAELKVDPGASDHTEEVLALNEGLEQLAALDPRQAEAIDLYHFAGLSVEEIAKHFGIAERTVKRDLQTGRLFLRNLLQSIHARRAEA